MRRDEQTTKQTTKQTNNNQRNNTQTNNQVKQNQQGGKGEGGKQLPLLGLTEGEVKQNQVVSTHFKANLQ